MKTIFTSIVILLALHIPGLSQVKDLSYFGQTPPGMIPEVFAPHFISTSEFEFCGTFSPDGKEYFFTRRLTYAGSDNRIYYTQLIGDAWSLPTLARTAEDIFEFEPAITPDGSKLYFYSDRVGNRDDRFDGDLWVSVKTGRGWSEPKYFLSPINKKYCMTLSSTQNGTLYFSSGYDGKRGVYRSEDDVKIEYLPAEINDIPAAHPYISPDESFLIMDAQVTGRGKPELFISFRNQDGTWTKAENMGPIINATHTEFGASLSPDGKYLFFHRRVKGNGDIYWVSAKIIDELREKAQQN